MSERLFVNSEKPKTVSYGKNETELYNKAVKTGLINQQFSVVAKNAFSDYFKKLEAKNND